MELDDADLEAAAEYLLLELHDRGHIQLVNRATARSLAPALSRILLRIDPATSRLADWLIEQKGVNEVFSPDDVLGESLEHARAQLHARTLPSAKPLAHDFVREDDRWVRTVAIDLGWGAIDVRVVLDREPGAAELERVAHVERLLPGSWTALWEPAFREHWSAHALFRDPARAAAVLEGVEVYLAPDKWSVQLTFDAPGLRTSGFFFELKDDRIVDSYAVD
jgi:hypothetical protein